MKKVLFIGNRAGVLEKILDFKELSLEGIYLVKDSFADRKAQALNLDYTTFTEANRQTVIKNIQNEEFNILISNGCPFILPIDDLGQPECLFVNIHPSLLPKLKGLHAVNGALLYEHKYTGATMHYMDNDIDAGRIIHQEKFAITPDIDLRLLYQMLFELEAKVFSLGMRKLLDTDFNYDGVQQSGRGSYYSRSRKDMEVDFETMAMDEILKRIRAFGIESQGVNGIINGQEYLIFEAERIENSYLLEKYLDLQSGALALECGNRMLMKTKDGIIIIKRYREV